MPLDKNASVKDWINDFISSDAPQFEGKTKKERIKMAVAAHYGAQNESVELEETSMSGGERAAYRMGMKHGSSGAKRIDADKSFGVHSKFYHMGYDSGKEAEEWHATQRDRGLLKREETELEEAADDQTHKEIFGRIINDPEMNPKKKDVSGGHSMGSDWKSNDTILSKVRSAMKKASLRKSGGKDPMAGADAGLTTWRTQKEDTELEESGYAAAKAAGHPMAKKFTSTAGELTSKKTRASGHKASDVFEKAKKIVLATTGKPHDKSNPVTDEILQQAKQSVPFREDVNESLDTSFAKKMFIAKVGKFLVDTSKDKTKKLKHSEAAKKVFAKLNLGGNLKQVAEQYNLEESKMGEIDASIEDHFNSHVTKHGADYVGAHWHGFMKTIAKSVSKEHNISEKAAHELIKGKFA